MTDDLVNKLRAVDHLSLEDCFCQSSLYEEAAIRIETLNEELRVITKDRDDYRTILEDAGKEEDGLSYYG